MRRIGCCILFCMVLGAQAAPAAPPAPSTEGRVLWLRADAIDPADASQVRVDGDKRFLVRWADQTPAERERHDALQADAGRQPQVVPAVINGRAVVRFDRGRVDSLTNSTANLIDPGAKRTIVVVGQARPRGDGSTGGTLVTFRRSTAGGTTVFTVQQWLAGVHYVFSDGIGSNSTIAQAAATTICSPFVASFRSPGAGNQITVDLNGIQMPVSGGTIPTESGAAGFTVGNREDEGAHGQQGWDGDIAEVLVYSRELPAAELEELGTYLAGKYHLATEYKSWNLPAVADRTVDFKTDVYPILEAHCFACHRGRKAESGYRLDQRDELLGMNNGEPLVEIGRSARSRLIHLVSGQVAEKRMPPEDDGDRLSAEDVGMLRAWIDQGLKWDEALLPSLADELDHWAFKPVAEPAPPQIEDPRWLRTPVDAFVARAHREHGLAPAAEAPRRELVRRLSLDLLGLPPTNDEVETFVADAAPDAYEQLVDRYLESPHYGEHWARHWLDVARWADTEGYETNTLRPFAWRYRDYVVDSFNRDKPFDRFLREQLAGDELLPYSDENLIATGFIAAARLSVNEDDLVRQRNDALIDVVNATGSAVLGLTIGCAQCHNHKFDPITQRDYYRLQGCFVKGQLANLALKDPALWKQYEALADPKAPKPQTIGFYSPLSPTPVDVLAMEAVFPLPYEPEKLKQTEARLLVRGDVHKPGPAVGAGWPAIFGAIADPQKFDNAARSALVDWLVDRANPLTSRVWVNRVWQYHFGRGLVEPAGDFGLRGGRPSHAELLDFLASQLMQSGWSTKHVQRLIVLSSTYRQSSAPTSANLSLDADNTYLWRWQPRRLEAESLRDTILAVSGELDRKLGGPSIPRSAESAQLRRSLYLRQDRNDFPETQVLFDGATAVESCARRNVSTVPLQPLYLLNSDFMVDRARAFGRRVLSAAGPDSQRQIEAAYRLALARAPDADELAAGLAFLQSGSPSAPVTAKPEVWTGAQWVWDNPQAPTHDQTSAPRYLRRSFELPARPAAAQICITADDRYTLFVNGQRVGASDDWNTVERYDVGSLLVAGKNAIAIEAINGSGPAGAIAWLQIAAADQSTTTLGTAADWKVSLLAAENWQQAAFDDSAWPTAVVLGPPSTSPWSLIEPRLGTPPPPVPLRLLQYCHTLLNLNELIYID
jgi:hypothetical protein